MNIKNKIFTLLIFLLSPIFIHAFTYEDAEDYNVTRWIVPSEANILNIFDNTINSRIIQFNSTTYKYFKFKNIENNSYSNFSWKMKTNNPFYIYIYIDTKNGKRLLYYNGINQNNGISGTAIHHGLGKDAINNQWHQFDRDLNVDLKEYEPNNEIVSIEGFKIKSINNFSIDDVKLFNVNPTVDTTPPVITLNGDSNITLTQGSVYVEQNATAIDAVDGNVPVNISGTVDSSTVGTYRVTYSASDNSGNSAIKERQINVIATSNYLVIEDAEDGLSSRWITPLNATINNIFDSLKGSRVLKLSSSSYKNYMMHSSINSSTKQIFQWDMKVANPFYFYIYVKTVKGDRVLYYNGINRDNGISGTYIHHGLGRDAINNQWHTFRRDLNADIKDYESDNQLISIDRFKVRSTNDVYLDNIELFGVTSTIDTTPPVITLNGDSNITLTQGSIYIEKNASAIDAVDGNVSVSISGTVDTSRVGTYTVTYLASDSSGNSASKIRVITVISKIGARVLKSTPINRGTIFISPLGTGEDCTEVDPCAFDRLDFFSSNPIDIQPGDVVFFRGGIYNYSMNGVKRVYLKGGTLEKPIIYESYPGEIAIFDGSQLSRESTDKKEWKEGRLELRENYTILRKIEVRNMPQQGVQIFGSYNIVEGCKIHHNNLSGVKIYNLIDGYSLKDSGGSHNIIRDNIIYENSDVGLTHHNYNNGGNADGINVQSGVGNSILHNTVYNNSDDGIDVWKSISSIIEYNLVSNNGNSPNGDGNGIKLGGDIDINSQLGSKAVAKYNISYSNDNNGINTNSGKSVLIEYNTVYNNRGYGYTIMEDTRLISNISFQNNLDVGWSSGLEQRDNSWQRDGVLDFINLNPKLPNFLKPTIESGFSDIGAYRE